MIKYIITWFNYTTNRILEVIKPPTHETNALISSYRCYTL